MATPTTNLLEGLRSPTALGKLLGVSRQRAHQLLQSRSPAAVTRLAEMLESVAAQLRSGEAETMVLAPTRGHREVAGRLTVAAAASLFEIPTRRIHGWIQRGYLSVADRAPGPGPGGLVLVDSKDVAALVENPPKVGRPII